MNAIPVQNVNALRITATSTAPTAGTAAYTYQFVYSWE